MNSIDVEPSKGELLLPIVLKTAQFKVDHRFHSHMENVRGVDVVVTLSPFFLPESIEATYDQNLGCLVIQCKYFDEEPQQKAEENNPLFDIYIGEHTSRLMSLHLKVEEHKIGKIDMFVSPREMQGMQGETPERMITQIHSAIQMIKNFKPKMTESYNVVEEAIVSNKFALAALVKP